MEEIVKIPQIFHKSQHCYSLIKIWQEITQLFDKSESITCDFQKCSFLSHLGVAFLGGMFSYAQHQNKRLNFAWDTLNPRTRMNLEQKRSVRVGFQTWNNNGQKWHQ